MTTLRATNLRTRAAVAVLTASALATAGCGVGGSDEKTLVAHFDRAIGVYEKSDLRVQGVRIGSVTKVTPEGDSIKVEMTYESKYKLPADGKAMVISPSIVSDRYVQVTPTYNGGPVMANKADLPLEKTAVPVELDEIYQSLDDLGVALGPEGANKNGSLSRLIETGARNLEGNGEQFGTTLADLGKALTTLANQREDLFGTVTNLQDFTTTLARSDAVVRQFNSDLAAVSGQLAGEREELGTAVRSLSIALGEVATFVQENRKDLKANVDDLASITGVLVKQRAALEEFLDNAPTGLSNLALAYNPSTGTLDTRDNNFEGDPLGVLCRTLAVSGAAGQKACADLRGILEPITGPIAENRGASAKPTPPDASMGGILEVSR